MSKLNPTSTAIALALAGLVAAGCASQATSDNESADNAASGQSDVVSQANPLDQPAQGTSEAAVQPSASGQQYSEASQTAPSATDPSAQTSQSANTTSPADMTASQPSDPIANAASTTPSTSMSSTTASPSISSADSTAYDAERPLPPRADRN